MKDAHNTLESKKSAIMHTYGPWTAHNIHLGSGVYTIEKDSQSDLKKLERVMHILETYGSTGITSQRILDLACLEGLYSIEAAKRGANVVSIDIREQHLAKCTFAKEALGLTNVTFHCKDVRDITTKTFGDFDTVLMLGILYHLPSNEVMVFLENIAKLTKDMLVIDTHIALTPEMSFSYRGVEYEGSYFLEHPAKATPEEKIQSGWASIDNDVSVWLTLDSLIRALKNSGFSTVTECLVPAEPEKSLDRVTLIAKKPRSM